MQRRHRLGGATALTAVRKEGEVRRHPLAVLVFRPNELAWSRVGFSASRRVGNAVRRNRARRRLREAVRRQLPWLSPGWDCLFIALETTADAPFADLEMAVAQLLRRAGVLCAQPREERA